MQWTFQRFVPLAHLSLSLTAIEAPQARLSDRSLALFLESSFFGLTASPAELEAACSSAIANSILQGKRQAQDLARAAGYDAGDLLGLVDRGIGDFSPSSVNQRYTLKK